MKPNVGTHGSCVHNNTNDNSQPSRESTRSCVHNNTNDNAHPSRKSPRAQFHNYSGGIYFVTICTADKQHYFGKIRNGEMLFSEIGRYCHLQLEELPSHYPYAEVPLFVVMPNHVHAIICIKDEKTDTLTHEPCVPTFRSALSVIIGGMKRAVTVYARRNNIAFDWQKRYHDHIIRNTMDANRIGEYIENNIARWCRFNIEVQKRPCISSLILRGKALRPGGSAPDE